MVVSTAMVLSAKAFTTLMLSLSPCLDVSSVLRCNEVVGCVQSCPVSVGRGKCHQQAQHYNELDGRCIEAITTGTHDRGNPSE